MSKEILRPQAKPAPAAQPEQEPVAWMDADGNVSDNNDHNCFPIPLYTTANIQSYLEKDNLQPEQEQNEFELRGKLATLKCWHRLSQEEEEDLLSFAAAQPAAAQRPWVSLTDEELDYLCHLAYTGDEEFVLIVQAKLKEKNT